MNAAVQQFEVETRINPLDLARDVVVRQMRRRGVPTTFMANRIKVDRSYLGRMLNGERPTSPHIIDLLINELELDRQRLILAVMLMRDAFCYFDPRFQIASRNLVEELNKVMGDGRRSHEAVTPDNPTRAECGILASREADQLSARFDPNDAIANTTSHAPIPIR